METKPQKKGKYIYLTLLIVFLVILGQNGYRLYSLYKESNSNKQNLTYTNKSKIDYSVTIKENDFISQTILPSNKSYITELVDKIDMVMEYNYESSENMPISQENSLTATIYGLYNATPNSVNNPTIWEKEYVLKSTKKTEHQSINKINVKEFFEIDLDFYNKEAIRFKEHFAIPSVVYLEVKLNVSLRGLTDKYYINETYPMTAKIPLTEHVFFVDAMLSDNQEKLVPSSNISESQVDQRKVVLYATLLVGSLLLSLITIKKLTEFKKDEDFLNQITRLKKEYNEIIVETDNMVDTKELKPVVITSFDEMLNLADSLMMPIFLYEEFNLCCFYIVKNDIIYSYLIRNHATKKPL